MGAFRKDSGWTGGQYSLVRVALAVAVAARALTAWSHLMPEQRLGPPLVDLPTAAVGLALTVTVLAAVPLALGWRDSIAGAAVGVGWTVLLAAGALPLTPGTAALAGALTVHLSLPPAPYGSLAAVGRNDPAGGWSMPEGTRRMTWVWWFVAWSWLAVALFDARPWWTAVLAIAVVAGWIPPLRRFAWLASLAVVVGLAVIDGVPAVWLLVGLLPLWLQAFRPTWIRGRAPGAPYAEIFYDGACGLCHRAVRFVLAEDPRGERFRFAPLHGDRFNARVDPSLRDGLPDSLVLCLPSGELRTRSAAALGIGRGLGGVWRVLSTLAAVVPRGLRDRAYDGIARVRHRLFARPEEACPILPVPLRKRFDT